MDNNKKFELQVRGLSGEWHFRILVRETGEFFMGSVENSLDKLEFYLNEIQRLNSPPSYVDYGNPYFRANNETD